MPVTTFDQVINALANSSQQVVINKASQSNVVAGQTFSLWLATGIPALGAVPAGAAICARGLTGGFQWDSPTGGNHTYVSRLFLVPGVQGQDVNIVDRLAHMGGLSGTVTTAQTVNVDVTGTASNLVNRRGAADYSDVQWWVEWYTATGATARNLTVTYTSGAGTSGRQVVISDAVIGATARAGRMIQIVGINGEPIRSVESVQWDLSTGTAGNFGVTATRYVTGMTLSTANVGAVSDYRDLGLPRVHDDACLFMTQVCGSTTTGALYGSVKLIQG